MLPKLVAAKYRQVAYRAGPLFCCLAYLCTEIVIKAPMSEENVMNNEHHVQHMFLHVESSDAVCMLNIAGHPYRLRELVFMMIENGCRVAMSSADAYKTFNFDKETVEVYDFLTSIIKAKFV